MDFLRKNRLEIKMIVSSKTASYIVALIDFILIGSLLGTHIRDLVNCLQGRPKTNPFLAIPITFIVVHVINLILVVKLIFATKRRNIRNAQIYSFTWIVTWLTIFITFIISLVKFNPPVLSFQKNPYLLTYWIQVLLYPILLIYKPVSLFIVNRMIVDIIRERRSQNNQSSLISKSESETKRGYGTDRGQNKPGGLFALSPRPNPNNKSPSPSPIIRNTPLGHGTTGRGGKRDSELYETVQGIEDLLHEMEFPTEQQVYAGEFEVEDEMLTVTHDFFVKKGYLNLQRGSFAKPTHSSSSPPERVEVAIKTFRQNVDVEAVRTMLLETKLLTLFRHHPNIIKLMGFCTENIHKGKMMLFLEFCSKGTVEDILKESYGEFQDLIQNDKFVVPIEPTRSDENIYENVMNTSNFNAPTERKIPFNSKTLLNWSFQIANGMEFIQSKGVVHGNLMAKICIVDERNRVKIANFTFATQLYHFKQTNAPIDSTKIDLPYRWMGIECMKTDPPVASSFTEKSDVWSYGVVLWELFTLGCTPYEGLLTANFFPKLVEGERLEKPPFSNSEVYNVMRECWHQSPGNRPTFTRLKHTFRNILQNLM